MVTPEERAVRLCPNYEGHAHGNVDAMGKCCDACEPIAAAIRAAEQEAVAAFFSCPTAELDTRFPGLLDRVMGGAANFTFAMTVTKSDPRPTALPADAPHVVEGE